MRKALLFGCLLFHVMTHAQKSNFEYGVQGGINLNNVYTSGETVSSLGSTTGLSVGTTIKWNKTAHFGIRVQPGYEQLGWAYRDLIFESGVFTGSRSDLLYKLNYLNLPVLAEYTAGKKIKWSIGAGLFGGYLLTSRMVVKNKPPLAAGQPESTESTLHSIRRANFGLTAGTGIQIPLSSKIAVAIQARNYTGLTDMSKPISGLASSLKTMTFSFLGGIVFRP